MPTQRGPILVLTFTGLTALGCGGPEVDPGRGDPPASAGEYTSLRLEQGWSRDEAQDFYYTTQGSQLIPYGWFLALERAGSSELFRSDGNLRRLGFLPQPPDPRKNPDGLPIGFVKDDRPTSVQDSIAVRRSLLGADYAAEDFPTENSWLGLTCAACHTGEIRHGGRALLVDGAPAMMDYQTFAEELVEALAATGEEDAEFASFAQRVLGPSNAAAEAAVLRRRLIAYTDVMAKTKRRNTGPERYGFARLDAFGAILNAVCDMGLEIPANYAPASAPVSIPFLWNAPHLDWVQWNGSIANPLARNVGEVLGVFAHFKLTGTSAEGQFTSTAHIPNLDRLEQLLTKLSAPRWPEEILGAIDRDRAERGRALYAENCAQCHSVRDAEGRFPMTEPNRFGKRFIQTVMVPFGKIGTDPQMIRNLARQVDPGALRPLLSDELRNAPKVPAPEVLRIADEGVIHRWMSELPRQLDPEQLLALTGHRDPTVEPPDVAAYKARPLDGIWATAPFLHNGSVPNLHQLLLPAKERTPFHLGLTDFDPELVGFGTESSAGSFEFRTHAPDGTPIPGNSNAGHEGKYYTQRRESETWRDFTAEERRALIEYMKTLH